MSSSPNPIHFSDIQKIPKYEIISTPGVESILKELEFGSDDKDEELKYLSRPAPNVIEWITGTDYWNVPSTFKYWGQYQLIRDFFSLRCRICNSSKPEEVDCWGKPRSYLESENLLVWNIEYEDFICPKCRTTMAEFVEDGIITPYNEMVAIVGMRGGKSYTGAHIGGYIEHLLTAWGIEKKGTLQRKLGQEKSEWFEINFAASTEKQAEKTIYSKYRQMRRNSPWVNRYMDWVKIKEKSQIGVKDPWKYRTSSSEEIYDGYLQVNYNRVSSDSSGVAGATRIATFLDEWARLIDSEGTRSASEMHRVLNQGLKTIRSAVMMNNNLPHFMGLMVAITSPIAIDDPAMQTYTRANEGILKKTYAIKKATWEFNPFQPREAFDEEYERDPVAAERDFGANPPAAITPFVTDPARFWKSINWDRKPIAEFSEINFSDETGSEYVGSRLNNCMLNSVDQFYIFADAGLTFDTFSLACGHSMWIPINNFGDKSGKTSKSIFVDESARIKPDGYNVIWPEEIGTMLRPDRGADSQLMSRMHNEHMKMIHHGASTPTSGSSYEHKGEILCTVVDFCLRIIPTETREVWFDSIIKIVEDLRKKINISAVCFDRWNSVSSIQTIRNMGIQSYTVTLKVEDFLSFREMTYNNRIDMLPPSTEDSLSMSDSGILSIGTPQEQMAGESVVLVEVLKLSRSPDLKKIYNINKGRVRGRDSDDLARCVIGLHNIIQHSVVDEMANTKKKKAVRKRLQASHNPMSGTIFNGRG